MLCSSLSLTLSKHIGACTDIKSSCTQLFYYRNFKHIRQYSLATDLNQCIQYGLDILSSTFLTLEILNLKTFAEVMIVNITY